MPFDIEAARKAGYSDDEIQAYLKQQAPDAPQTAGQKIWHAASAPMREVARLGGKLDVAAGLKTPKEAEANVERYGDLGTQALATGLGGVGAGALKAGSWLLPAAGRAITQGGVDALKANSGEQGKEFLHGAETGALGEATGGLLGKILTPFKTLRSLVPSAGPRAGEKWVRDYQYGTVPGRSAPVLVRDVLENTGRQIPSAVVQTGQTAYDQGLDQLRKLLGM